jgi:hypothetical protein
VDPPPDVTHIHGSIAPNRTHSNVPTSDSDAACR